MIIKTNTLTWDNIQELIDNVTNPEPLNIIEDEFSDKEGNYGDNSFGDNTDYTY